jgi:hypothetical protein
MCAGCLGEGDAGELNTLILLSTGLLIHCSCSPVNGAACGVNEFACRTLFQAVVDYDARYARTTARTGM